MATRRTGSALVRRFMSATEQARRGLGWMNVTRRDFSTSSRRVLEQGERVQLGLVASASPGTYQHVHREMTFPWAFEGFQSPRQTVLHSSAEAQRETIRVEEEEDDRTEAMKVAETKKIVQQVNAVALKKRLQADPRDSVSYRDLLDFIKESGVVANDEEAMRLAHILDEAGVVIIFRQNVYIHPERVAKLVANAIPFAVVPPNDPRRVELLQLEEKKAKIDAIAHNQVRKFVWTGLILLTCTATLAVRLTFWELSWDVIEPIAFFLGSAGLICGYAYFLFTAKDPSYRECMERLFRSRQMNLFKKRRFDYMRYQLLKRQCQCLDPDEQHW